MKFGIATFITDNAIGPAELGRAVEERGFHSLFTAEHSHIPASRETPYPGGGELPEMYYRTLDPFVSLTAAATATESLVVGTGIALVIQRDTIHTANEVASLDHVSGGRFVFGIGAGWNREEMRNHGTDPRTRGALLDEKIRAMRELWTAEQAEFHGRFVDFDPVFLWPKPVQKPHPPIWVGGNSDATFRRIAEYGDGWLANAHPAGEMATQIAKLRDTAGREVPVVTFGVPTDAELVEAYQGLGIERVDLFLPPEPRDQTLAKLDEFVSFVGKFS